jgi:hypothetical protein
MSHNEPKRSRSPRGASPIRDRKAPVRSRSRSRSPLASSFPRLDRNEDVEIRSVRQSLLLHKCELNGLLHHTSKTFQASNNTSSDENVISSKQRVLVLFSAAKMWTAHDLSPDWKYAPSLTLGEVIDRFQNRLTLALARFLGPLILMHEDDSDRYAKWHAREVQNRRDQLRAMMRSAKAEDLQQPANHPAKSFESIINACVTIGKEFRSRNSCRRIRLCWMPSCI